MSLNSRELIGHLEAEYPGVDVRWWIRLLLDKGKLFLTETLNIGIL